MSTTTHPFAPEEIMALLDGELPADRAEALSAHIDQCAECSTLGDGLRGLSRQMTGWQVQLVPERLAGRVAAATAENSTKAGPLMGSLLKQQRSPRIRFALGVVSSLAAILLLMAISIPNLLRSRMAANEASAVGSLRTLNTAAVTYSSIYGHYPPSLESFGRSQSDIATENGAGLIDDVLARGGPKSGYLFTYRALPALGPNNKGGYTINADPLEPSKSAQRHFSTDETGVIRFDGGQPLDGGSPETPQGKGPRAAGEQGIVRSPDEATPLIARRAELRLMVAKLDEARRVMDQILAQHKGYVAQLSATAETGSERMVVASLRVPADQLDACIAELKKLGLVTQESQAGEEVTQRNVDLLARLKNSRNTEARLHNVLQQPGGKIKDILDVEKESARVRGEIEQMEAEQQTLEHRVDFATIDLKLTEEYKAQLSSPAPSVASQLRNASVNGFRNAFESLLALMLFFAEAAPTLLLWLMFLSVPAWFFWRRYRRALAIS
jgi:type IV pilus assembly protein PilA